MRVIWLSSFDQTQNRALSQEGRHLRVAALTLWGLSVKNGRLIIPKGSDILAVLVDLAPAFRPVLLPRKLKPVLLAVPVVLLIPLLPVLVPIGPRSVILAVLVVYFLFLPSVVVPLKKKPVLLVVLLVCFQ